MKNQVLSIEQMRQLQELGVGTSEASLFYDFKDNEGLDVVKYPGRLNKYIENGYGIGAFTLQDLINQMPHTISKHGKAQSYLLAVPHHNVVEYVHWSEKNELFAVHEEQGKDILEAAFNMLVWLAKSGHLRKEEKQ